MRRIWAVLAALALVLSFPSAVAPPALGVVDAGSCGAFSQTTAEHYTCVVPAGVTSLTFEVRAADGGAAWGGYYSTTTPGGLGAKISGTLAVTPGETLYVTVGSKGWGQDSSGSQIRDTGGGGGYSSIARMVGTTLTPLVVAGGGGGAGTADYLEPSGYAEAGRGGNGGITGTGGDGAGGNGGTYLSQTNGIDGGTGTTGGAGGTGNSANGFAGGDEGQNGNPQLSAETPWLWGNNRPGAGGGGFGAVGGRGNPNYFVPSGNWPYVFGAPGQGSTAGGGGGGGGLAGGGGGGTLFGQAGGGGGGGSSLIPTGATAVSEAGSAHVTLSGDAPTAPANDNLADAILLTGTTGSASGTTLDSTTQAGEAYGYSTVWYRWASTARKNLVATFSTCDAVDWDSMLTVYTSTQTSPTVSELTEEAYSDDACATASRVVFLASPGVTYWIRLAGYWDGDYGNFTLTWTASAPVSASLNVTVTNTQGDPASCTLSMKGTNLLADQEVVLWTWTGYPAEARYTDSGRWTTSPQQVARSLWNAQAAGTIYLASAVHSVDGYTEATLKVTNRCKAAL